MWCLGFMMSCISRNDTSCVPYVCHALVAYVLTYHTVFMSDNCHVTVVWHTGVSLQWRHNERDGISNYRRCYCLLDRLSRRRTKKISKVRVTGLCEGGGSTGHRSQKIQLYFDKILLKLIQLTKRHQLWPSSLTHMCTGATNPNKFFFTSLTQPS